MPKKKVLVWETQATVSGGQKMTLLVMDLLKDAYDFFCLIPGKGMFSEELDKRNIPYAFMGDQSMPAGVKGKQVIFRYGWLSVKNIVCSLMKIAAYKPDLLYAPGPAALPWSAVCGMLTGKPVIWHLHHMFLDGSTKKLLNICAKWKCVKDIIAVSHYVGDQIVDEQTSCKVKVLYNPVDVQKYAAGNSEKVLDEIEAQLNRSIAQDMILAHIGAITKNKHQDAFVRIVHEFKNRGIGVVGIMVGEAITTADRQYKQELMRYILTHDLSSNVYAAGFRTDVADILSATDCVVVTSNEGLGLVAMEAMSSKTRVVGMSGSGTDELFKAAQCGVSYPADGTEKDAVDAIQKYLKEAPEVLEAGYRFCLQQSRESYRKQLLQIF